MKCRLQNILTVRVAVLMSAVAVALGGCRPFVEVEMLPSGVVEHTLVMYLNANNNLAHHIKANALDAERGMMGALPSTRLVIYLDEAESTTLYEVRYLQYGSANYVKHTTVLKEYPEQTSTSPEVISSDGATAVLAGAGIITTSRHRIIADAATAMKNLSVDARIDQTNIKTLSFIFI